MFDSLDEWLDWQSTLNPSEIELGLDRVRTVWSALGPPLLDARIITVAGTNGKGSSVALLDAILAAAGYRVGTYTSPHLLRYNERVSVQSVAVSDEQLCDAFSRIESARGDTPLTYFEFGTLAALLIFSAADLDAVVLEVGLGGRLDAVNLVDADVALITPVGLDHQAWLGKDIETIAAEKAGIMRSGRAVIYAGASCPEAIIRHAEKVGARLYRLGREFAVKQHDSQSWHWLGPGRRWHNLPIPALPGKHQLHNTAGVLMVLDQIYSDLPVDAGSIRKGLLGVRLPGRLQYFPGSPSWLFDVAHNPQAAQVLADALAELGPKGEVAALFALLDDKDPQGIAAAVGKHIDYWALPALQVPRAMSPQATERALHGAGVVAPVQIFPDVGSAIERLKQTMSTDDLIVVFGSFHTVGEAIACYQQ